MNLKRIGLIGISCLTLALVSGCADMSSHPGAGAGYNVSQANKAPQRAPYYFPPTRTATGNNVFIFDPQQLAWAAYNPSGELVRTGIASGGRDYCSDIDSPCRTPVGTFKVYHEGNASCKSSIFPIGEGGAPMPNCMFFRGGFAVHGSYDVPAYNASHGCVRVTPADAAWLNSNFINVGTTVIVRSY
jgi:lipoprotein-anchoring transpeptidase ErfK/SrfK